jgi:hypothetical protein
MPTRNGAIIEFVVSVHTIEDVLDHDDELTTSATVTLSDFMVDPFVRFCRCPMAPV